MLNNRNNRASAVQMALPFRMALPFPSGGVNATQRQFIAESYAGIIPTTTPFLYRDRRLNALQIGLPFRMLLPFPTGSVRSLQRSCLAFAYFISPPPTLVLPPLWPLLNYKAAVSG